MSTTARSASSKINRQKAKGEKQKAEESAKPKKSLKIEVLNRQRIEEIDRNRVAQLSRSVLDRIGREDATMTVTFLRDRAMRELNRNYRGIDKPTDVLSFAYHESDDLSVQHIEAGHLGDIVISIETAAKYARELGLTLNREIDHLIIHGALHLAGYDHETDNGEMKKIERKLRKELLGRC